MKFCFVFCHGFGFDISFWENLSQYFVEDDCIYLDLGYFNKENVGILAHKQLIKYGKEAVKFVGIGHSLGLLKLISLNIKFEKLIGLQSFINFLGFEPVLYESRKKDLSILKENFAESSLLTLKTFYKRCGLFVDNRKLKQLNQNKLSEDLEYLINFKADKEINNMPLLIIGAKDDIIVPPELIEDNFSNRSNVKVNMYEKGQHSLGCFYAADIYKSIKSFVDEIQ